MRLFAALALPDDVATALERMRGGIPGAHWEDRDKLHLTLRFFGDVDGGVARSLAAALPAVRVPAFSLELAGAGHFPPRGQPRSVWIGTADDSQVRRLHDAIERVARSLHIAPDRRNFAPHVTLARLSEAPEHRVAEFLARESLFRSAPMWIDEFHLYSSVRTEAGSKYRIEHTFELPMP